MQVLIAEDNNLSRKVLETYLKKWEYEVHSTGDGNSAWEVLKDNSDIKIAILDWVMPGYSGVDLCKKIREEAANPTIHIILLSGKNDRNDMVFALEAGADDYVIKPFDPVELSSRIKVGCRLVRYRLLLEEKNNELEKTAKHMEQLAEERAKMLVHADRLASLGVLTAGIAHEINNPTTFISGNAQTLERCRDVIETCLEWGETQDEKFAGRCKLVKRNLPDMLQGIRKGVERISQIVNGLKTFGRVGKNARTPIDINEAVEESLMLCANKLRYHVKVEKVLQESLPQVLGDQQRIEQVFINLFVNAADAMEEKGGRHNAEANLLSVVTKSQGGQVIVEVKDSGPGIPPNMVDKIWNPFFTTKDIGKGTGLGLSISHGIIRDHDGDISVENLPEGGALFRICLPIVEEEDS